MEAHAALAGGHLQLLAHRLPARVLRQLQIVDAGHHRRQVVVRVLVAVHLFAHDRQRRRERLEPARRQPRTPRHKLQKQALLVAVVVVQDVVKVLDGLRVLREAVVRAAALGQHPDVPALVGGRAETRPAEHILQLLRVEHAQPVDREDRVESCKDKHKLAQLDRNSTNRIKLTFPQCLKLARNALDQEPVRHQRNVLVQVVDGDGRVAATPAQLNVRMAGQHKVQAQVRDRAAVQIQSVNLCKDKS